MILSKKEAFRLKMRLEDSKMRSDILKNSWKRRRDENAKV
jgi:hypothetical protein